MTPNKRKVKDSKRPRYITANKDVNIIYDTDKKEFYLKVPKTCLLKCHIPKDEFIRAVEKCFINTNLIEEFNKSHRAIKEAVLRLVINPKGKWKVCFSSTSLEIIEFTQPIKSADVIPSEVGELLYKKFITCNGKLAVDITVWY